VICFDTDVMSAIVRVGGGPPQLARRLGTLPATEQSTTAITIGELVYGARRRGSTRLERAIDLAVSEIEVHPLDESAARVYAELRTALEAAGQRLDDADLQIASICVARDLTLVTGNIRHFERVPGLRVANWLE
jgi:tRNA(fMet)-specific endonuclease VapC